MTLLVGLPGGPAYQLSGTLAAPNQATDVRTQPTDASAGWRFNTDGTVDKFTSVAGYVQFLDGIEYTSEQDAPNRDQWMRATPQSDPDAPTSGSATGSWLKVAGSASAAREWLWDETTDGAATTEGSVLVELALDSAGVQVVASGYYDGHAETIV